MRTHPAERVASPRGARGAAAGRAAAGLATLSISLLACCSQVLDPPTAQVASAEFATESVPSPELPAPAGEPAGDGALCAQAPVFDWGEVRQGDRVSHRFELHNGTPSLVRLLAPRRLRPGLSMRHDPQIAPGASGSVVVDLDTSALQAGLCQVSVPMRGNVADAPVLHLRGRVLPPK